MPKLCPQLKQELQSIQEKIVFFDAEMEKVGEIRNTKPILELRKEIQERIDQLKEKMEPLLIQVKLKKLEKIIGHEVWHRVIMIGGKTKEELIQELEAKNRSTSWYVHEILEKIEISENTEQVTLVCLDVEDLGFTQHATTEEIYQRAEKLKLELCPAEVGPHLRIQYSGKERMLIAMKQMVDDNGNLLVFYLCPGEEQPVIRICPARIGETWSPHSQFVFRLIKN